MANDDDLEEGIQPFSVGNRGTTASQSALTNAANYDLMHQGNLDATTAAFARFRQGTDPRQPFSWCVSSSSVSVQLMLSALVRGHRLISTKVK
jgi:hypothetical protein